MNFEPEQVVPTAPPAPPPPVAPPAPEIPPTGDLGETETPCPGPSQLRVGDVTQSGDERVIGHRLLKMVKPVRHYMNQLPHLRNISHLQ